MSESEGFPEPDDTTSALAEVLGTAGEPDPVSVWQGELSLSGVTLHVHVLDDGTRIIEAADLAALLAAWQGGATLTEAEAAAFARWRRGVT